MRSSLVDVRRPETCESLARVSSNSPRNRHVVSSFILFVLTFVVFVASPTPRLADSKYTLLLSESLLINHTPNLAHFQIPGLQISTLSSHPDLVRAPLFYELINVHGRLLYYYSHGSSILSIPWVAMFLVSRHSVAGSDRVYHERWEAIEQHLIAATLMAVLALVFLRMASVILPAPWDFIVAAGASFGSQIWSTASRALWSHTWEIVLLGAIVLELLEAAENKRRLRGVWVATLVSWLFFVRPTGAIVVAALTIYICLYAPDIFVPYVTTGFGWLAAFVAYSWLVFSEALPGYYREPSFFSPDHFFTALFGCLVSPSRGLLIFVPSLFFVAYLVVRYWQELPHRRLAVLAITVISIHQLVLTGDAKWWGGYSYGPRLSTDLIPWFVLLAILGLRPFLEENARIGAMSGAVQARLSMRQRITIALGGLLLALSIMINARGAFSQATLDWNARVQIDRHPERVWDLRSPQFLAGLFAVDN